jgi:hypothetical protein
LHSCCNEYASDYEINAVALNTFLDYYVFADARSVHIKDFRTKREVYTIDIDDAQHVGFSSDGKYIYIQRGDYNGDDYNGNTIIRVPFPTYYIMRYMIILRLYSLTISFQKRKS